MTAAALLRNLRQNGEREVRLVGTDKGERAIGRHICDSFHRVPPGGDPGFAEVMLDICRREGVDAVLPISMIAGHLVALRMAPGESDA